MLVVRCDCPKGLLRTAMMLVVRCDCSSKTDIEPSLTCPVFHFVSLDDRHSDFVGSSFGIEIEGQPWGPPAGRKPGRMQS